ncbi:MAG: hypothetical protein GX590_11945, partial [Lentisphaerae bacterium]|nr:hypothetical protein [Lentisphaerota bacterium]
FDTWAKAATNLQAAIDAAGGGYTAELVVSNGVYTAPAEILVAKALPIRSAAGAAETVLKGEYPAAMHRVIRFTTASGGSGLDGFTITNGYLTGAEGAGIYVERATGKGVAIRNCLVAGNEATDYGGGVHFLSTTRLGNCTVVRNTAGTAGGGVYQQGGTATNMIVAHNVLTSMLPNDIHGSVTNFAYSCASDLTEGIAGNRAGDPRFVQPGRGYGLAWVPGDYRLKLGSPAVDGGVFEDWMAGAADLAGQPRVVGSAPDMGAFEGAVLPPGTLFFIR